MQRNTLCPAWDEAYEFDLGGCRATELTLELLDWSLASSCPVSFPLSPLLLALELLDWCLSLASSSSPPPPRFACAPRRPTHGGSSLVLPSCSRWGCSTVGRTRSGGGGARE